jgi:hypothetical protein
VADHERTAQARDAQSLTPAAAPANAGHTGIPPSARRRGGALPTAEATAETVLSRRPAAENA